MLMNLVAHGKGKGNWIYTALFCIIVAHTQGAQAWITQFYHKSHHACLHKTIITDTEFCCSAGVFLVEVRAHHRTPPSTTLVEGGGADRLQAGSPCLQVSARCSTTVPRRRTLPASRHRSSMSSAFHHGIVTDCPPHAAVNRR